MNYKKLEMLKAEDLNIYGGKAANLALLKQEGFNVPDAIALDANWSLELLAIQDDQERLARIKEDVTPIYDTFEGAVLAVRSSAIREDLSDMSFAGLYDTVLNVGSLQDLVLAVNKVVQSLESDHVKSYDGSENKDGQTGIGILLQKMVKSFKSGVMFTANPISGNRQQVVVNAALGYGDKVVDGIAQVEESILNKDSLEIIKAAEVREVLSSEDARELAQIGLKIEASRQGPQDIEWTYDDKHLYILQTRDITTLYPIEGEHLDQDKLHIYMCYNTVIQGMSAPFTPLGHEYWRTTFAGYTSVYYNFKKKIQYPSFIKSINGRIYYDLTEVVGRRLIGKNLPSSLDNKDPAGGQLMAEIYNQYLKAFRRQGASFRLSFGIVKWGIGLTKYGKISKKDPHKGLAEVHQIADDYVKALETRIENASTAKTKVKLLEDVMDEMLTLGFKLVMYCAYGLKAFDKHEKWLKKKYGDSVSIEPVKLGVPNNPTTEMGLALAAIAKEYKNADDQSILTSDVFKTFIETYGHRGDLDTDMGVKRWTEDPSYLLELIHLYQEDQQYDVILERYKQQQVEARACLDSLKSKLKDDVGDRRANAIISDLENYRFLIGIREYPKFIAVKVLAMFRAMFLELGQEMVSRQQLENAEDISYLYLSDMLEPQDTLLQEIVDKRKAIYNKQMADREVPRFILSNGECYWQPSLDKNEADLKGIPLSAGQVEGVVRLLDSPVGAELDDESIIVCHNTDPSWTPLFLAAKGLVMESGGPISHGAIVAREYGLPAIGGVSQATTRLVNGQRIRMDGRSGLITLIE